MAANQILSLPAAATGLAPDSSATAWTYGTAVTASASLGVGINIIGLQFQVTNIPTVDATQEILFDITIGGTTKVQIPYTQRSDTAVGYYQAPSQTIFLPEPYSVPGGSAVAVKVTDSLSSAITYNGVKILYQEKTPPAVALNTPADVATGVSTTPDLLFTGTDAESDEIEYNVQVDTVNTFDSQVGAGNVYVMTWGAGGGAQGSNNTTLTQGRGGGGGAFAGKTVSASNATGYSIAVGAGGAGGAAGNPPGGGVNGGDSTFATTTVVAKGGNSGGNSGTGGLATASTGDDKYNGGTGAAGSSSQAGGGGGGSGGSTAAGSNGSGATGGAGGTPDGGAGGNSSGTTGQVGTVPGGGGGAGDWQNSGSAGADGKVVIRALLGVVTSATGGTKTSDGTYDYWTFTAGGTWTPTIGTPLLSKLSVTPDATFTGTGDPHPWPSGNQVTYTVQAGNILTASTVYYWRVRGTDPLGSNTYGAWATTRSFTTAAAGSSSNIVGYKTLLGAGF